MGFGGGRLDMGAAIPEALALFAELDLDFLGRSEQVGALEGIAEMFLDRPEPFRHGGVVRHFLGLVNRHKGKTRAILHGQAPHLHAFQSGFRPPVFPQHQFDERIPAQALP